MNSTRQKKFSRLIQRDLGEIFQQNSVNLFNGAFITVTQVQVSPDLGMAKVYLSFLLAKNKDLMMEKVEEQNKHIRMLLANRIRNQARVIPALHFYYDDTQEVYEKVEKLFEGLDIPPAPDEDEKED